MVDPLGLAASAATRLSSAVAANYKRGRDERRQVYRRFQEAAVAYVIQLRDSRISPKALGLSPSECKPYIDAFMKATTEFAQALYEVRLVGNPGLIDAAEGLKRAIVDSFDAATVRREELTEYEAALYAQAMHAFTEECRRDLRYHSPRWQIRRPSWWQRRRQGENTGRSEEANVRSQRSALIAQGRDMRLSVIIPIPTEDETNSNPDGD